MFGDAGRLVSSSVPSVSFVDPKFNVSSPCRAESLLLVCTERQREREREREKEFPAPHAFQRGGRERE